MNTKLQSAAVLEILMGRHVHGNRPWCPSVRFIRKAKANLKTSHQFAFLWVYLHLALCQQIPKRFEKKKLQPSNPFIALDKAGIPFLCLLPFEEKMNQTVRRKISTSFLFSCANSQTNTQVQVPSFNHFSNISVYKLSQ